MKERLIDMSVNEDKTLIKFDEAKKKAISKSIKDGYFVFQTLLDSLSKDELEVGFSETLLSLMESHVVDIHKGFNFGSVLAKEKELRHQELRELNKENHELRQQLGTKASPEDVRECLKNIESKIRAWWEEVGFGHVSNLDCGPYVIQATLCCIELMHLDNEAIERAGYEVYDAHGDCGMAHTHENINILKAQLKERFPSSEIVEVKVLCKNTKGSYIREARVLIRNYEDVVSSCSSLKT